MNRSFLAAGLIVGCLAGSLTGCQSVRIVKGPTEYDTGVRFYRPKPYLLITPADPTGRMVNLKLEYLPDYNEEYSAHLRGKKAAVALKDGWNLVGVNMAPPPPEEKPPAPAPAVQNLPLPNMVVAATNVPMGFYEAIYDMAGPDKYLKGWRYIGFSVLAGTRPGVPNRAGSGAMGGGRGGCAHGGLCGAHGGRGGRDGGADAMGGPGMMGGACMDDGLYGLVFFNGTMTFRRLEEIAANQLCPSYVRPTPLNPELPAESTTGPQSGGVDPAPTPPSGGVDPATPSLTPATPSPTTPPAADPGSTSAFRSTSTSAKPARSSSPSLPPLAPLPTASAPRPTPGTPLASSPGKPASAKPASAKPATASRSGSPVKLPKADASLSTASLGSRPAAKPAATAARPASTPPTSKPKADTQLNDLLFDLPRP